MMHGFQAKIMYPERHKKTVAEMNAGRGGIGRSFLRPIREKPQVSSNPALRFLGTGPRVSLRFTRGYYPAPPPGADAGQGPALGENPFADATYR